MKVGILAGGLGTRLAEHTDRIPKPMVEIGGRPILWHIMNEYSAFGHKEFVVALGYKAEVIKDYFVNYPYRSSSLTVSLRSGDVTRHDGDDEDWLVNLLDTGLETETGGRVKRIADFVGGERFFLTYGDGVSNIDIDQLLEFHERHGKLATMTAVRPPARYGAVEIDGDMVVNFQEKPQLGEGWISGGFFVFEPELADYINGDDDILERGPLTRLVSDGQLAAYRRNGYWQCMDTVRELRMLQELWDTGSPPWTT